LANSRPDPAANELSEEEIERMCLRNLMTSHEERVYFKDREGRFLAVSAGMEAIFRRNRPDQRVIIGKTDDDFSSPQHAAAARANALRVLETGEPSKDQIQRETFDDRPDDWAQTSRLPLVDDDGTIVGTWGITRDITAQVIAERRLVASRRELEASERTHNVLFEDNPQPTFMYDRETLQLVAANHAVEVIYGYPRAELLKMTVVDLMAPEDAAALEASLGGRGVAKTLGFQTAQTARHRYKDGSIVEVEITSNDVVVEGRACRVATTEDVTERNRASAELTGALDAAVEASNMKSAFLANVSHEIRTPMNGVIGLTELLLDTTLDEDQRSLAVEVSHSGRRMVELINSILDISKIEANQLEIDFAPFSPREMIEQACAVAGLQARASGLQFTIEIADAVPEQAMGDGPRLRQVLLNLVSNAVKFTSEGGITVRASVLPRRDPVVRLEVVDTGIGIDPGALDSMFEPFTQADASTTRKYGGTGLGLAIALELTRLMGGTIGAESNPGAGSTFWIELPLVPASVPSPAPANAPATATTNKPLWSTPPLVLVVEDSPVNQIVAVRTLERCGCEAEAVAGGHEALAALAEKDYDVVLMDCQMPGMDGYQATSELRRREHGARHTPVIAMTAHAMEGAIEACKQAGMDDYLSKPLNRDQLTQTLVRWLPQHAGAVVG
jgi:PAS domain S-box-containing protein